MDRLSERATVITAPAAAGTGASMPSSNAATHAVHAAIAVMPMSQAVAQERAALLSSR